MFDFFGLCRELRDQIYDRLLDRQLTFPSKRPIDIGVKNGPHRKHMLVNRQFSAEYLEAVRRRTSIVCIDNGSIIREPITDFPTPNLPPVLRSVRRVEFRIWLLCSNGEHEPDDCALQRDLDFHCHWTNNIVRQMEAPNIIVLLGLSEDLTEECEMIFAREYGRLIPGGGLGDLAVRRGYFKYKIEGDATPRVTDRFNAETRMLEPVHVVEGEVPKTARDFGFSEEEDLLPRTQASEDDGHDGSDEDNEVSEDEDDEEDESDEGESGEGEDDDSEDGDVMDGAAES